MEQSSRWNKRSNIDKHNEASFEAVPNINQKQIMGSQFAAGKVNHEFDIPDNGVEEMA
jgi:hypothetical protein